ncbi:MAG TPA: hypothetical protein VFN67_38885, partial [Polyangiales bacterium]|nr:hypothetical protein [Polyangiales bacterium]
MSHRPLEILHRTEVLSDPYPYYAALRGAAPVFSDEVGRWFVTRYDHALALLVGDDVSVDRLKRGNRPRPGADDPTIAPLFDALTWQILFLDPPHHTRLRALVSKAFTPSLVQAMGDAIRQRVDALLDRALGKGWLDVIDELALPLPLGVICDMLAVPAADRGRLRKWSCDYAAFLGSGAIMSLERLRECCTSLCEYMAYFHDLS